MNIRKGTLKTFNPATYTATIQLAGSRKVYLEDITVARSIPAAEMTAGRNLAVVFFDEYNAREAVITAVYT